MKHTVRALAMILALQPALAAAQSFPQVLPPNTVVGRTGIGSGPAQAIPFAQLSQFMFGQIPNNTVIGNVSGGSSFPSNLTATQLTTLCNTFTSSLKGCVPASGGGTTNFLRADGTFAAPPAPQSSSVLDAKNFGVVCDGVAVNTTAWATAIAAFSSSGGTLNVPTGVCLGTIVLNKANIILQGQGWSTSGNTGTCGTEIRSTGAADNVILASASGVQVRDLCVTSSVAAASRTGAGVKVTGGPNVLISRVFSNGHKYGIWNQFAGNEFEHVFTVGNQIYGQFHDGSLGTGSLNETAIYYSQSNSNPGSGIGIIGGGFASTGIFMVRPTAASNGGAGIVISGAINDVHVVIPELSSNTARQLDAVNGSGGNLTVVGGLIEVVSGGGEAINTGTAQQFVTLTGNIITAPSGVTIIIAGTQSTLSGNIISGAGTSAIIAYGAGAGGMTISGNTISGNSAVGEVGISIAAGLTGCMIGTNIFTAVAGTQITDGTSACTYAAITTTKPTYP